MYKVITLQELADIKQGTVLYNTLQNYKLCYIDEINKTYYDYTPEAKAYRETEEWKEQDRLRTEKCKRQGFLSSDDDEFSYWANPVLRKGSDCQDYPNPDYIKGEQELYAYFTPLPLDEQCGDDWNDAPYEHNAGIPYDDVTDEVEEKDGLRFVTKSHDIVIIQVPFALKSYNSCLPKDYNGGNSYWAVDDINRGAVAWIYDYNYTNKKYVCIYAGNNPFEFAEKINQITENNPNWEPSDEDDD